MLTSKLKSVKMRLKRRKKKLQKLVGKRNSSLDSQKILGTGDTVSQKRQETDILNEKKCRERNNQNHRGSNNRNDGREDQKDETGINCASNKEDTVLLKDADNSAQYICSRCQSSFNVFLQFSMHAHLCKSTAELHQCPVCLEEFEDIQGICLHLQDHEDDDARKEEADSENTSNDEVNSDDNELVNFNAVANVGQSRLSKEVDFSFENLSKYQCSTCFQVFTDRHGFRRHLNRVHPEAACFKCEKCNVVFAHQKGFKHHLSSSKHKHNNASLNRLKCTKCDYIAYNDVELRRHLEMNPRTNLPKFVSKCPHCTSQFCGNSLAQHMVAKHGELLEHKCDVCSKIYSNQKSLRKHAKSHISVSDHRCSECKIYFAKYDDHMTKHEAVCKADSLYNCRTCENLFPNQLKLTRHIILGLCPKPVPALPKCPHCDYVQPKPDAFKMRRHIESGSGRFSKLYHCLHCDSKYCSSKALTTHTRKNHHQPVRLSRYKCNYCHQAGFARQVSLAQHEKTCKAKLSHVA